jgi:hypothetical protein
MLFRLILMRRGANREMDVYACALSRNGTDAEPTVMAADPMSCDGEAQPGPLAFRREKGSRQTVVKIGRDAGTVVLETDFNHW